MLISLASSSSAGSALRRWSPSSVTCGAARLGVETGLLPVPPAPRLLGGGRLGGKVRLGLRLRLDGLLEPRHGVVDEGLDVLLDGLGQFPGDELLDGAEEGAQGHVLDA